MHYLFANITTTTNNQIQSSAPADEQGLSASANTHIHTHLSRHCPNSVSAGQLRLPIWSPVCCLVACLREHTTAGQSDFCPLGKQTKAPTEWVSQLAERSVRTVQILILTHTPLSLESILCLLLYDLIVRFRFFCQQ